jgi:hypothetical protein
MAISNDWNINYLTKQINHLQWKDEITATDSSIKEVTYIDTVADSTNSLNGKYFFLWSATDATKYYVWYKTSGGSVLDPAPAGATGVRVDITTNDTANTVATNTKNTVDALADFVATVGTNRVTVTNANFGSCTDASNVDAGFTITINTQGVGKTVWSTNALYSYLQDTFDELGQMDDQVPMSAQTPTEYSLINGWFIDEVSIKYLKGGAIKTVGWASNIICQIGYNSTIHLLHSDIGKVIVGTTTADTGTILFFDERTVAGDQGKLWIRPTSAAADLFNNGTEAYTVTSGTGTGVFTAVSTSGENTWANMYTIGTIESNTAIYIVQDGTKLSAWWPVGHIDILIRVREIGSTTGVNTGDLGQLLIGAREYSKLFDHFVSTGITGGRNPVPLATAADLNNTTGQYQTVVTTASAAIAAGETFSANANSNKQGTITSVTGTFPNLTIRYYLSGTARTAFVNTDACTTSTAKTFTVVTPSSVVAGYSDITLTFAYITRNLNNGAGLQPYDVEIDLTSTRSVAEMYEWLKFLCMRGYAASPQQLKTGTGTYNTPGFANINGEQYISALSSFTPVKASPFGTFAGGKFFGAQGVWLKGVPAAYAQNYQLIDSLGVTQVPPNTVSVTVSSVIASDVVGVFPLTGAGGTVEKTTRTVTTGTLGANSVVCSTTLDARTPQSGVIRIVDMSNALKAETQYEYYSWSSATFTLNSSAARSLTLTATGSSGSNTVLIDTDSTFRTWKVRPGDTITNTTDSSTATVVTVDSQTQLTTTALASGSDNTYANNDSFTFETKLTTAAETGVDTLYIPIINEMVISPATSVSNTLIYTAPVIPVLVRVRQGKVILPFEIENEVGANGMSQAAIRTTDTIAT